jgi:catechol 2,3-dioxygenase-like lactoylglutathione lyase family enzyme
MLLSMLAFALLLVALETTLHHVHLNTVNQKSAEEYFAKRFEPGPLRFNEVKQLPPAALTSAIWHIGWGSPDPRGEYQYQVALGTKYATMPTNLPEAGPDFFFSYVETPEKALVEINNAPDNKFRHVHLFSDDPIAAAEWYIKHLGLKTSGGRPLSRKLVRLLNTDIGPTANLTVPSVQGVPVSLGIFPVSWARTEYRDDWKGVSRPVPSAGRVVDHLAFAVADLDGTLAKMKADGVKVLELPKRQGDSGVYVEGPDRILIELVKK